MNIFHRLCKQDTIDLVSATPDLLRLVAELCQQFKVKVLDHNRDTDHKMRILLAENNGVPFGVASTDQNNKGVLTYRFQAMFIEKERGRGTDRMSRESVKLPALMKLLKKDHEENYMPSINQMLSRIPDIIKDEIQKVVGTGRYMRDIGSDATKALLGFYTEQKMITDPQIIKTIDEYILQLKQIDEKKAQLDSKMVEYKTDLHFMLECGNHTFIAGTLKYDVTTNKYSLHEDVNCYASIEDLEQTQPQLMLSYKMYRTGVENKVEFREGFVPRRDNYSPDFEVITHYVTSSGMPQAEACNTSCRIFFTPKLG